MPTYLFTEGFQFGSISQTQGISKTADGETSLGPIEVANGATVFEVFCAIDVSALKGLRIVADQALTLKTNSSGAPDDTIVLVADQPLDWYDGSYYTKPLTVDVVKFFVANASGEDADLYIFVLQDPTP